MHIANFLSSDEASMNVPGANSCSAKTMTDGFQTSIPIARIPVQSRSAARDTSIGAFRRFTFRAPPSDLKPCSCPLSFQNYPLTSRKISEGGPLLNVGETFYVPLTCCPFATRKKECHHARLPDMCTPIIITLGTGKGVAFSNLSTAFGVLITI